MKTDSKGMMVVRHYGETYIMTFDPDLTATELVERVIAPMMITMGYFPTSVYEALGMNEALEVCDGNF